jgi:hypothetical protein
MPNSKARQWLTTSGGENGRLHLPGQPIAAKMLPQQFTCFRPERYRAGLPAFAGQGNNRWWLQTEPGDS